ncbi:hypothetical protein [Rhodococcoides kyotonense]|uniref:Uncharacterized protein n=1 Tax=Rhodococcoides kyotonense TaxID=398843 RepID=A0A239IIY4_9NOCA|nr:hypothetical protein [Rhodococcus kyotonensis]SNS93525.1 hypothetical protein SAMN05421642_10781 [Rhodococcus kyotonensis]
MDDKASRLHDKVMTALVITSIVSAGIVVAGLTAAPEEPALTVQPVTPTQEAPTPPPEEYVVVTPEVEYPTSIPGCDDVDPPVEDSYSSFITMGDQSYDNPIAPWFSGPKAQLMSEALLSALPTHISFEDGVPYFDPIPVYNGAPEEVTVDSTNAYGSVITDTGTGSLSVAVSQSTRGVEPCVAGDLDERSTMPDGTVVDALTTWREVNGDRTYARSVTAYHLDGSQISAYSAAPDSENALPLSVDELVSVVTASGLRTSSSAPPGTPGNISECSPFGRNESTRKFTGTDIAALNSALTNAAVGTLAPSPALGALRPSAWGDGLCQIVNSAAGTLTISVGDAPAPDPGLYASGTMASVETPSGLSVTVQTELPWERAELERIAVTPGLDQ